MPFLMLLILISINVKNVVVFSVINVGLMLKNVLLAVLRRKEKRDISRSNEHKYVKNVTIFSVINVSLLVKNVLLVVIRRKEK